MFSYPIIVALFNHEIVRTGQFLLGGSILVVYKAQVVVGPLHSYVQVRRRPFL